MSQWQGTLGRGGCPVREGAVVRVALLPLVIQSGDLEGNGSEETVVFPAQVIVQANRDVAE